MSALRRFLARLSAFFLPGRAEHDLAREVGAHLALMEGAYRRQGLTADDARRAARADLGRVDSIKQQQRDARSFVWLEEARRDVRLAVRSLARVPGVTAIASLTIACGMGSVITVFTVVHAVVLQPLPFDRPEQLVRLVETVPASASPSGVAIRRVTDSLTAGEIDELRRQSKAVSHLASYANASLTLTDIGDTARLEGWRVEPMLFPLLGVRPLHGRAFDSTDAAPGALPVVIVGYGTWQQHLGGRQDVIGQSLTLDGKRYAIIGVMPRHFTFPVEFPNHDFWLPLALDISSTQARGLRLPTVARLASGTSPEAAASEVGGILRGMRGTGSTYAFVRVQDEWVAPVLRPLVVLGVAVGLVLLVAAVNISSLLMARTATRQREIAIRAALGGRRSRIIRLLLTESTLLALVGGVIGVGLAWTSLRGLQVLATTLPRMDLGTFTTFPRLSAIAIDTSVLAFTVATALVVGIVSGIAPALRYTRFADVEALRQSAGSTPSPATRSWSPRGLLVMTQVALAMVLLSGAGLLARSYLTLTRVDLGYRPSGVLTFQVALPPGNTAGQRWRDSPRIWLRSFDRFRVFRPLPTHRCFRW